MACSGVSPARPAIIIVGEGRRVAVGTWARALVAKGPILLLLLERREHLPAPDARSAA
jgi:hypothetical protein